MPSPIQKGQASLPKRKPSSTQAHGGSNNAAAAATTTTYTTTTTNINPNHNPNNPSSTNSSKSHHPPATARTPAFNRHTSAPNLPSSNHHTVTGHANGAWTYSSPNPNTTAGPNFPGLYTQFSNMPGADGAEYVSNAWMPNTGQHFQPQVPDSTYGPYVHRTTPRTDGTQPGAFGFPTTPPVACGPMQQGQMHGVVNMQMPTYPQMVAQPQQPIYLQQPQVLGQAMGYQQPYPVLAAGQPCIPGAPGGTPYIIGNATIGATPTGLPGLPGAPGAPGGPPSGPPDIMGVGKTRGELMTELCQAAKTNGADDPQDFKPADDDPSRMYWCREADGDWIQRNRYAIDRLEGCRWFIDERGRFYVVRSAE